ncbi:uncharacterized protein [Aegilops tauschii subsp. strangulata]|uniref:uncharacterized protein n=1 Tax=Aegilops tauschii subsp. strangulata TaxID=200361 RepID=UPI003CC896CE
MVKTKQHLTLLTDLKEMMANLHRFQIKLNLEKCIFGVLAGQLLGFLVLEPQHRGQPEEDQGDRAHEQACSAARCPKVHRCLASLSWFVSRLGERALPLYQLMKKTLVFDWTDQADEAFHDLKRMLSTAPILPTPAKKEPLLMYIAATSRVVSVVLLVVELREEGKA